ncbi:MAG: type II toxin-antitoxin system HicB family antitoxin [Patescibacteria group bacterium]
MKNIIQFIISQGVDGYFVAKATDFPIFTQGKTLDEITKNISEATELYLEVSMKDDSINSLTKNPSVLMNYEIPFRQYA